MTRRRLAPLALLLGALLWPHPAAAQWTAPRTWTLGELVTAAIMNTHIRDNLTVLRAGGISITSQAAGDLFCATDSTSVERIDGVATGSMLISAGTSTCPTWTTTPIATSIDMGTTTIYGSRVITVDPGGVFDIALSTSDFTVDTDKLTIDGTTGLVTIGGNLVVSGTGPHAYGGATNDYQQLVLRGSFTSAGASTVAEGFVVDTDLTAAIGDTTWQTLAKVSGSVTTQANMATIPIISSLRLHEPVITKGDDTVTASAVLYLPSVADEGAANYVIFSDSTGVNRFDGDIGLSGSRVPKLWTTDQDTTNAENVSSWSQIKRDITPYAESAVDLLSTVQVVRFQHIDEFDDSGRVKIGMLADSFSDALVTPMREYRGRPVPLPPVLNPHTGEMEERERPGDSFGVGPTLDTGAVDALMVKAIQELDARVEVLEGR